MSDRILAPIILLCAAVIVLGGLADRMTHVAPTVRDGSTSHRQSTTLVALADRLGGQERYLPYLEIERTSPRASIVLDDRVPTGVLGEDPRALVHEPYLYALSGAREFRRERFDVQLISGAPETASASFLGRDWRLHLLEPGSAGAVLLVWHDHEGLIIADARLVAGWSGTSEPEVEVDLATGQPRLRRAALVDAVLLASLFVLGGMVLPTAGLASVVRGGLALTVGLALQATAGLLRFPGAWSVLLVTGIAVGLSLLARQAGHRVGWSRRDQPTIATGAVAILSASLVARWAGFIWVSPDSVNYLAQSRMLADGVLAGRNIDLKRGIGQQSIHAPGFTLGVEGLQSLGLATLILAVLLVAALPLALQVSRLWVTWGAAVLLGVGLLALPAFPIMAAYVNSHVLVAVLLLGIAVLLGLERAGREDGPDRSSERTWAVGVLVAGLVLLRPEGTLLAAAMLIGATGIAPGLTRPTLRFLGGTTIVWNLILIQTSIARAEAPPLPVIAMLVLGAGLLLLPTVRELIGDALAVRLPLVMAVTLWAIALLLSALGGDSVNFLRAATANLGQGQGNWGALGLAMVILGIAVAGWPLSERAGPGAHAARWTLVSFVPMTMITKLGDGLERSGAGVDVLLRGGGRVGWGDSVNRMWTHVLLLVLLLAVVSVSSSRSETASPAARAEAGRTLMLRRRRFLTGVLRAVVLTAAMVWVASAWDPFYLEGTAREAVGASAGDRFLLLLPILLATAGGWLMFDAAARRGVEHDAVADATPWPLHPSRVLAAGLALVVVGGLTTVMTVRPLADEQELVVLTPRDQDRQAGELRPAGEMIDGSAVAQPLEPGLQDRLRGLGSDAPLCLEVLLATYLDRDNVGEVEFVLSGRSGAGAGAREVAFRLPASSLEDNAWAGGCFEGRWDRVPGSPSVEVIVRGLGAPPGRAVTVWMRPSGDDEPDARVTGILPPFETEGHALSYRFTVLQPSARAELFGRFSQILLVAGIGSSVVGAAIRRRSTSRSRGTSIG